MRAIVQEVERCLAAIRTQNASLNAFTSVRNSAAILKEAETVGIRLENGTERPPREERSFN